MLGKRVLSAVIGIILLYLVINSGEFVFNIAIMIITVAAMREYYRLMPYQSKFELFLLTFLSLILAISSYMYNEGEISWSKGFILYSIFLLLYFYNLFAKNKDFMKKISYNLLGILYIGGGLSFFILLRNFAIRPFNDTKAIWFVLIATWLTDTGAYFIGKSFGKTKLAPQISPNKTVEGALGGIIFSSVFVIFTGIYFNIFNFQWLIFSISLPLLAIMGDLFESSMKRDLGVKDMGSIIPGHGGILDRFDSLIFTIPFTYYILLILFK